MVLLIPNQPDESVPVGGGYDHNKLILESGKVREFDFPAKDHIELGESLGIIDFARGAKITGSGFYVLKGDGARLERAMINYMLDVHRKQGYVEVFPPVVVNRSSVIGTGQYPKMKDDMYWCERDDLWLNPTAEVPLTNMFMDEILEKDQLPINFTAYLPSFRREAGRHAEMKGIIRVHEFNKVELVKFVHPNTSWTELERLRQDAEDIFRGLELPYRVLLLCTGDMGFASAKTYDIESWAPGTKSWLECSSCSCFTDFQARRARIKYRPEPHLKSEFLHTLNGSGVALAKDHGVGTGEQPDEGGEGHLAQGAPPVHARARADRVNSLRKEAVDGGSVHSERDPLVELSRAHPLIEIDGVDVPVERLPFHPSAIHGLGLFRAEQEYGLAHAAPPELLQHEDVLDKKCRAG